MPTIDFENLGAAPDLSAIDFTKLDMGNDLPTNEPETKVEEPEEVEIKAEEPEEQDEDEKKEPESEEKVEKTPEEKAEEDQPRDEKGRFDKKEAKIPKSRFDEAVGKEREAREAAEKRAAELEARLRQQEKQQEQAKTRNEEIVLLDAKVSDLVKKHAEHMLDGDVDKATAAMQEIRKMERQIARMEAQEESSRTVAASLEQERLSATIARLESDHPELNPRSENYDNDLVQMVLLVQKELVNNGVPGAQALSEATQKVMGRFHKASEPAAAEVKEGLSKAEQAKQQEDRKKQQVTKSLETQKRQPSSMKDVGMDSDKAGEKGLPDVNSMSVEEYNALPETVRARLRGDLV